MPDTPARPSLVFAGTRQIPDDELVVRATRAGGAGGQHVNTSSTRVEISWQPGSSRALTDDERERVTMRLATRLDGAGFVRVVASDTRSQRQNRELAESRLRDLLVEALKVPKKRKATRPSRAAKAARLDDKLRQSRKKADRRSGWD